MRLTVLSVSYPLARVSPGTPGGAEQVLATIDRGLVRAGYRSLVLAPAGSRSAGLLVAAQIPGGVLTEDAKKEARCAFKHALERALTEYSVDIIHMHGIDFYEYLPTGNVPVVVSLHLPLEWYPQSAICDCDERIALVSVSEFQARTAPSSCRIDRVIANGVDLEEFRPTHKRGTYLLAMGRLCPEKGFHFALDAAGRVNADLILAGMVFDYPGHRGYFDSMIAPCLGRCARFVGCVGGKRKRFLLAGARCLLIPSQVQETSSLLAMEAMACGTPVIAWRSGALPELVCHGRTGFLVSSVEEMAEAITRVGEIDRAECRREAERRFDSRKMVRQYIALYERIASRAEKRAGGGMTAGEIGTCLNVRMLRRLDEIRMLRCEWRALFLRCRATAFQSPDWLLPWLEVFSPEQILFVEVRRAAQLIGVAPLLIYLRKSERVLAFMGGGVSDYLDLLIEPGWQEQALEAVFRAVLATGEDWTILDLTDLPPHSQLLSSPLFRGLAIEHGSCSVLRLPQNESELPHLFSRRQRANLRNARSRLLRTGGGQIEIATAENVSEFLHDLFALHTGRWTEKGQSGVLAGENVRTFHLRCAPGLLENGNLHLSRLRTGSRTLAVIYSLLSHQTAFCYLQGFDSEFAALSPGSQLMYSVICDAVHRGLREFDFLRGEEAYKQHWRPERKPTYRLQLARAHFAALFRNQNPTHTRAA